MKKTNILCGILALTILFAGCSAGAAKTDANDTTASEAVSESTETEASTTAAETTKEAEPFKFNPHVHTNLISEYFKDERWESFYNMCDAMREGKDTFECIDEECFKACTHDVFIGTFFPAACTIVVGDGYENGIGKLKYKMDKDKFLERQAAFEKEIERMLNEAIRTDYSEFEKVMGLYDYMCKNFRYLLLLFIRNDEGLQHQNRPVILVGFRKLRGCHIGVISKTDRRNTVILVDIIGPVLSGLLLDKIPLLIRFCRNIIFCRDQVKQAFRCFRAFNIP